MPESKRKKKPDAWVISFEELQEAMAPQQEELRRRRRRERAKLVVLSSFAFAIVVSVQVARTMVRWRGPV